MDWGYFGVLGWNIRFGSFNKIRIIRKEHSCYDNTPASIGVWIDKVAPSLLVE